MAMNVGSPAVAPTAAPGAVRTPFRQEALAAQGQAWLGRVQLAQPTSVRVLALGALAALLALGLFLSLAHYTRRAPASGVLVPDRGLIRVVPGVAGIVQERRVVEGQSVRAGDVLFVLALEKPLLAAGAEGEVRRTLKARQRSIDAATGQQRALVQARQAALTQRLQALEREAAQTDSEAALLAQRLALAEQALTRLQALESAQYISPAQVQARQEEVLGLRAAAEALKRQATSLARSRAELEGERNSLPIQADAAVAGLARDRAEVDREAAEFDGERRVVLRASHDGVVSALLGDPGQAVTPGTALASLLPAGAQLQALLYAPSSAIGFVRAGQSVQLRYEAFPFQKYGLRPGRVVAVSRAPLAASELAGLALSTPGASGAQGEPLFRITVALEPAAGLPEIELAPGMRLAADVLLERRRLMEWLFEPLLAWRQRQPVGATAG